jgi:formylmethanofuran dehydrogenase subunit E
MPATPPEAAMVVERCDRCGRPFPRTEETERGRAFCEPCRAALWRDERDPKPPA